VRSFVVEESFGTVRVFWLKQEELIEALRREAGRIAQEDERVIKIVLFGSLAEGRAVPGSDADLLVLLREDDRPFIQRLADWIGRFAVGFPVEVFPYTLDELDVPLARHALEKGTVLFERQSSVFGGEPERAAGNVQGA